MWSTNFIFMLLIFPTVANQEQYSYPSFLDGYVEDEMEGELERRSTSFFTGPTASFCSKPLLSVKYNGQEVPCGKNVPIIAVSGLSNPEIKDSSADERSMYTLIMYDPDAPSHNNPKCRSWLHWLVVNMAGGDVSDGDVVTEYNPPTPPAGSGPHRYRFVLLKQQKQIQASSGKRCGFDVDKFVDSNSLTLSSVSEFKTENLS